MKGIGFGFDRWLNPFFDEGGGGGGADVTALPEVPSPSDDDIDALTGDDDDDAGDDDAGDDDSSDEADEDDDADEGDEGDEEKPPKKKSGKDDEEEVIEEEDDDEEKDDKKKSDDKGDDKKVPSLKALKTAYPDIFKKFPHVRTAIAEHQQFRSVFTSVDEAKEAAEAQNNFFEISQKLIDEGDFGFLFDEIAKAEPQSAARMAKKILPAILERNKDLYYDITEVPIKQFVNAAFSRARRDGNKNLENSAIHLWRFLGMDGVPSATADPAEDPKDKEFQEKVKEFEGRKFNEARTTVNGQITNDLAGLIEAELDPNDTLKPALKKALINEMIRLVDADVSGDTNHMSRVERLWANARRSSYAQGHLSRIITAYLERAKQVIPKHARKLREENEIPENQGKRNQDGRPPVNRNRNNQPPPRPNSHGNPPRPRTIRDTNPRNIDWRKTSDEDILSGRAVLKGRS